MTQKGWNGRNALVTGASRGLGRALSRVLAEQGATVVGVARDRLALEAAMGELRRRGGRAFAVAGDVGAPDAAHAIAARAAELVGRVDLLVHCAGALGPTPLPTLAELPPAALAEVFEVNALGPVRLTRAVLGPMVLGGAGTIVGISSDAAVEAYPGWGAYGASKAALDHALRTFAAELEGTGVEVLVIDPGEMDTRMHAEALPEADAATLRRPEDVARALAAVLAEGGATGRRVVLSDEAVRRAS